MRVENGVPLMQATKHSVLLVDDDPDTAAMYASGLSAAGFVVTTAGSAAAALSAIKHHLPEIVVLDWQMPEMRGDELLEQLARNGETRDLPVFFLSNFPSDDPQVAETIVGDHICGWLVKSRTTPRDLAMQLLSALDGNATPRREQTAKEP